MNESVEGHLSGSEGPGIDAQVGQFLQKAKVDSFFFSFFFSKKKWLEEYTNILKLSIFDFFSHLKKFHNSFLFKLHFFALS